MSLSDHYDYKENQPYPVCGETIVSKKREVHLLLYALSAKKNSHREGEEHIMKNEINSIALKKALSQQ